MRATSALTSSLSGDRPDWPAEIRWARLPQRAEPGVHFTGERTGVGASGFAFRPDRLFGMGLGNIFDDRERLPDRDLAVLQRRALSRRRVLEHARARFRLIHRDDHFLERDLQLREQDPGPQRPRRIGFVGEDQLQRHDSFPEGFRGD